MRRRNKIRKAVLDSKVLAPKKRIWPFIIIGSSLLLLFASSKRTPKSSYGNMIPPNLGGGGGGMGGGGHGDSFNPGSYHPRVEHGPEGVAGLGNRPPGRMRNSNGHAVDHFGSISPPQDIGPPYGNDVNMPTNSFNQPASPEELKLKTLGSKPNLNEIRNPLLDAIHQRARKSAGTLKRDAEGKATGPELLQHPFEKMKTSAMKSHLPTHGHGLHHRPIGKHPKDLRRVPRESERRRPMAGLLQITESQRVTNRPSVSKPKQIQKIIASTSTTTTSAPAIQTIASETVETMIVDIEDEDIDITLPTDVMQLLSDVQFLPGYMDEDEDE